jgi:hypothetical protein
MAKSSSAASGPAALLAASARIRHRWLVTATAMVGLLAMSMLAGAQAFASEGNSAVIATVPSITKALRLYEAPEGSNQLYTILVNSAREEVGKYPVEPGTSPAVGGVSYGGEDDWTVETMFQAPGHELRAWASGGMWSFPVGFTVAANTSPTVAYDQATGGFQWAIQASSGVLYRDGSSLEFGMMAGTSPAITGSGEVAAQANNGHLWLVGPKDIDTGLGMKAGTSPSITELGGENYEVAFVANTGHLWTYCTCSGGSETSLGVESGTSPSIVDIGAKGWVIAFQGAGTHQLWIDRQTGGAASLSATMYSTSSPSISIRQGVSEVWEIVFQGKNNEFEAVNSNAGAIVGTGYLLVPSTSPAIAR